MEDRKGAAGGGAFAFSAISRKCKFKGSFTALKLSAQALQL